MIYRDVKGEGKPRSPKLRQDLLHDFAVNVGQSEVAALETIGQLGVIEA